MGFSALQSPNTCSSSQREKGASGKSVSLCSQGLMQAAQAACCINPVALRPLQTPLSQAAPQQDCVSLVPARFSLLPPCSSSWACKLKLSSCSPFPPGLEADLNRQLHGQHLAKEVVVQAVRGFLQSPQPQKALVLSFHGWSGTGKNFVARMLASHLYRDGLKSKCVRVFISLFHFPHHTYVDSYKVRADNVVLLWGRSSVLGLAGVEFVFFAAAVGFCILDL